MRIAKEKLKEDILNYLRRHCLGRNTPAKAELIARDFRLDIRTINDIIRLLRKDGILIGSAKKGPYGYYLPATEKEVRDYLDAFKAELFDMLETYSRQKRARQEFLDSLHSKDLFQYKPEESGQLSFI